MRDRPQRRVNIEPFRWGQRKLAVEERNFEPKKLIARFNKV